ncbi:hypothetical protein SAMN05519104_7560 [Rhizobiales bacterium GAS188]|nr:hypothetical protein SAMN05519104_7560 [Rhizobiales bacterium GAS188]
MEAPATPLTAILKRTLHLPGRGSSDFLTFLATDLRKLHQRIEREINVSSEPGIRAGQFGKPDHDLRPLPDQRRDRDEGHHAIDTLLKVRSRVPQDCALSALARPPPPVISSQEAAADLGAKLASVLGCGAWQPAGYLDRVMPLR